MSTTPEEFMDRLETISKKFAKLQEQFVEEHIQDQAEIIALNELMRMQGEYNIGFHIDMAGDNEDQIKGIQAIQKVVRDNGIARRAEFGGNSE